MISYSIRCDLCQEDFRGRSTNSAALVREMAKQQGWNTQIQSWSTDVCPECVKLGDTWVHLRLCLECGHVGCCDSSKNKHATKHFHRVKHPLIRSIEPGEAWMWCYVDNISPSELPD